MRKSDKKLDNQLRLVLTDVCEKALKQITGFQWLTHIVNYDQYPQSLKVICVFDTNQNLDIYIKSNLNNSLNSLIQNEFKNMGIKIKNIKHHVFYDTEEDCEKQHDGNWASRLVNN